MIVINVSSSLRPGTKEYTCEKGFIGYNVNTDYGAVSKFGAARIKKSSSLTFQSMNTALT